MTPDELEALKLKRQWLSLRLVAFCWLEDDGRAMADTHREILELDEQIRAAMMPPREQEGDAA